MNESKNLNFIIFPDSEEAKIDNPISIYDVWKSYKDARVHKRNTPLQIEFELHLAENLYNLYKDLNTFNYKIGKSVCFIVTRPKLREVFAASFRDRIVHHIVISRLMGLFNNLFIRNSFSCIEERGTLDGVLQLQKAMKRHPNGYVYRYDIRGFFMSIVKQLLNSLLQDFIDKEYSGRDKELIKHLTNLIVLNNPEKNCEIHGNIQLWNVLEEHKSLFFVDESLGLPIGNLTSQLFANFLLHCLDAMMYKEFGDDYGRYVDDFFIVCDDKEKVKKLIGEAERLLKEKLQLTLHPTKKYCQPVKRGCKFLGSMVYADRIYVGNETVSNFYKAIKTYNGKEDCVENICDFYKTLNSYLGFFSHCNSFDIIKRCLNKIDVKWFKYFEICSEKLTEEDIKREKKNKVSIKFKDPYRILNRYI